MTESLEGVAESPRARRPAAVLTALLLLAAAALPAGIGAQAGGPGFLFQRPVGSISLHGGYMVAGARSDLFEFTTDKLFLDRRDFDAPYVGGAITVSVADRWDVTIDGGHAWKSTRAEWQEWTEADGSPIWQTVSFSTTPVTAGARYFLADRGRGIGQFVWIPSRVQPYFGAGGGLMRYRFAQEGDFVDEAAQEIFPDQLETVGTAFTAYGAAGIQLRIGRSLLLNGEARYNWARDALDGSVYQEFEPMDLSGLRFTGGLGFSF